MNKTEPVGDWIKRQGRVHIRLGDAIELIQEIQAKRDNLGLELSDWVNFGDEVIGMVCDLFNIEEPEENEDKRPEAIKKVKELRKERDKLGNPPYSLVTFENLQGGIETLCSFFNITLEEVDKMVEKKTKEVTTIIHISCDGEGKRRVVCANWWEELSLEEIADTTAKIVKEIVGRGVLEEGTI